MTDRATIRVVAFGLMFVAFTVVVGSFWLANNGRTIPDALISMGATALGAGAALLARTGSDAAQDVQVVNEPDEPVPVATNAATKK